MSVYQSCCRSTLCPPPTTTTTTTTTTTDRARTHTSTYICLTWSVEEYVELKAFFIHKNPHCFFPHYHDLIWYSYRPEVLSQFNTFISKYESLLVEMQDPLLRQLLVIPQALPVEDPDFSKIWKQSKFSPNSLILIFQKVPRVLLRTKLIPEIEEEEQAVRLRYAERCKAAGISLPAPTVNQLDEGAIRQELRMWEVR